MSHRKQNFNNFYSKNYMRKFYS